MFKSKTHGKVNLKQKITKTIAVTMTGVLFGLSLAVVRPGEVQSAPSSYLNFQARLLTSSGAIVPDGNYHVEFKMYDVSSGGSALWTETRTTGNLVSVKSGYLSVYLGQVNAFPGTINWGEEHWLTMNIGGASGSASWDGEMNPRLRLTAVPHAFRADTAGNVNSASTNAASTNSSNVSITTGNAAGATSNSGSISIDSGTATGTTGSISLGASNASALTIGRSGVTTTLQGSVALTGSGTALTVTNDASIGGDLTVTGQVTATDGLTVGTGSNFVNQGSTLFTAVAVSDVAGGGNIGTAAATVDIATTFNINQTTASQTLTLPNPTTATAGRIAFVNNVGSASFTMYGSVIGTGKSNTFIWNGSSWVTTVSLSGSVVDTVGSVDSQTKSINGAVINGNAIYLQTADIDDIGLVSIAAQTFNGVKTFDDGLVVTTGGATITAGGLTVTAGGATITAGDLAVNSGSITSSSATLTINAGGTVDIQDNTTVDSLTADTGNIAITSGDLTTAGTSRLTNAGALQNITGYTQSSGAFAFSGAGNFSVDSAGLDVTTAGAVSGVTTLSLSGAISGGTTYTGSGNINTTAGAFQLNGTDINTAGTLTNVAYENQANTFTQANIFQGNVTLANTGYLATQRASDFSTTGTTNDANLGAASLVRLTGASAQTITGITGGADGRILTIMNAAAQAATISNEAAGSTAANRVVTGTGGNISLPAGASLTLVYDAGDSRWRISGTVAATGGSGVNTIGAIDGQTKHANGAVISGTSLYLQTADVSNIGLVSTAAQTFNGVKTFDDGLVVTAGGATITAGGLTVTAGGATITAGDLAVNSGSITSSSATLTINAGGTVDIQDNLTVQGTGANSFAGSLSIDGNTTIGNANTDTLTINGTAVSTPNDLNFDSNTLFIDAANNRIGVGTASPTTKLQVSGGSLLVTGTHTGTSEISVTGAGTRMFFDVGKSAFRAGAAGATNWDGANLGLYSAAFGENTSAGQWGFAAGQSTSAAAQAVAFGAGTNASGTASSALGWYTTAQAYGSMAVGQCNVAQGTTGSLVSTDTAFSIGNGTYSGGCSTNSNAFQVAYNGSTTVNGGTLLVQGTHGGGVGNTVTGAGTRMFFDVNKSAFRTGAVTGTQWNDANIGNYSFSGGLDSNATGSHSFAYGNNVTAAGTTSVALGGYTRANNPYAFVVGYDSGATGMASQVLGYGLEMQAFAATAIGYCNYTNPAQSTTLFNATEQLFAIGNGTYDGGTSDCSLRQNALEMTKNGNLAVDTNTLYVDAVNNRIGIGDATPDYKLDVEGTSTGTGVGTTESLAAINLAKTGNVTSGNEITSGLSVTVSRTGATGGTVLTTGINTIVAGDTGGTSTAAGVQGTAYNADTNYGVSGTGWLVGSSAVTEAVGVHGAITPFLSTTGSATNGFGLQGFVNMDSAATVTTGAGLNIKSAVASGGGAITNNYGVRIENQTAGASNYGLYIEGASTYALWVDSGATRLDGTLEVQSTSTFTGLATLNGGLTVEAGDTFTFNTDAITDLTGTGLTLSGGALTVDNGALDDTFFRQGGNSFAATAVLGTNDNNNLELETNGTTRLTIDTSGDATLTGNLTVQGTGASSIAGTLAVDDHVAIGAGAVIDGLSIVSPYLGSATMSSVLTVAEDVTDFSKDVAVGTANLITANPTSAYAGAVIGIGNEVTVGGSESVAGQIHGSFSYTSTADSVDVGEIYGATNYVALGSSGDVTSAAIGEYNFVQTNTDITGLAYGSVNTVNVNGTGGAGAGAYNITADGDSPEITGLEVNNTISTGTVTDQYGMKVALQSGVGSTITTAVGLDIADVAHTGTVTDSYALRVGTSSGATNNYGLAVEASATQTLWISSNADNTTAAAGLAFGSSRDTNLYRSAANTLMTDDSLTVAGNLSVQGNTTLGNANTDTLTITGTAVTLPNNLNFDSDTLFIDAANNRIGIGDATPDTKFDVEGTSTAGGVGATETLSSITFTDTGNVTSGSDITTGLSVSTNRTGATSGTFQTVGVYSVATGDTAGTSSAAGIQGIAYNADSNYGVAGLAYMVGSVAVTEAVGVNGGAATVFGAGLSVTNAFALQGAVGIDSGAAAITNAAGLNIKSTTNTAGGTITNNYGVRILNQTVGSNDYGLYVEGADTYAIWADSGATRLDGATTIGTGLTSGVALTVNNGTSTGNIMNLQDNGTTVFTVIDGGNVGIKTGSNAPTADLTFGDGANRTINVLTRTSAGAGNGLTVVAGAANGSDNAGGVLTLQGGSAGTGNAHGGNVVLAGGAGVGTGTTGLVVLGTPTFQTASVQNFTGSGNITAANVNGNGAILISSNAAGYTATLGDPTITTAGRVVYVTNTGSYDMTLSVNGGGTGNTVTLKPNTTATMIWNGSDWTAAGASSSTDLQAAYDNTATSAGGAEIVLRSTLDSPAGTGGLTIRNNATLPISGGLLEVQSSVGTNLFSVNNRGTELAANGGAETSGTFSTDWTAAPGGGTVTRTTTTGQYVTGQAGAQVATTGINHGIRNNLSANPVVSTTYTVSFTAKASVAISSSNLNVQYSRDGGTDLEACTSYSTQDLSTSVWTKITCTITTDGTTATNPDLIIRQGDATSRDIWIDNLSFTRNDSTTQPSNVQIGGGIDGGPITLFTLDRATAPPVEAGDSTYYGSMYYDITTGSIQCYEADGWGACGSPPDNIITLTPEYTGAVLNGSGVGTMTADFCGNGGGLSVNTTFCASGEARNYYRWTSPQASDQTYSIFVTYKLPSTFKAFLDDNTIKLTAYKDHATNASASLEVFRKNVSGGTISQCGSTTTITTGTSTWNTTSLGGSGETTCSFTGGDYVIFKINMMAKSNANVYVENLDFTFNNR